VLTGAAPHASGGPPGATCAQVDQLRLARLGGSSAFHEPGTMRTHSNLYQASAPLRPDPRSRSEIVDATAWRAPASSSRPCTRRPTLVVLLCQGLVGENSPDVSLPRSTLVLAQASSSCRYSPPTDVGQGRANVKRPTRTSWARGQGAHTRLRHRRGGFDGQGAQELLVLVLLLTRGSSPCLVSGWGIAPRHWHQEQPTKRS